MNHDVALNQATSSATVVALMASLDPQTSVSLRKTSSRPRPSFTSRSLSQLPRSRDCHRLASSEDSAEEEMMALLRSSGQCTTSSKSSTSSCHSVLGPAVITAPPTATFAPSVSPPKLPSQPIAGTAPMDTASSLTSPLSPSARRQLLRSARKVGYILGETPVLCTNANTSDSGHTYVETSELGVISPSIPSSTTSRVRRLNIPDGQKRSRPKGEMEMGIYDGLAGAFAAPHRYTTLSTDRSPAPFVPILNRVPPILKVDCTHVGAANKRIQRGLPGELAPDTDAQSFVSTTTMASDLFSPPPLQRSRMSPIEARFKLCEQGEELPREARRSKIAKLSRHLGEPVPSNLVFPPTDISTEQAGGYVLVTHERASPISPLANKSSTPKKKVIEPPMRSSSLRRRKRRSLQLDLGGSPNSISSAPSTSSNSSSEKIPIGSAPSKYKPVRKLSRSQSARTRARKHMNPSPIAGRSSESPSLENVPIHPASAPPALTSYSTEVDTGANKKMEALNVMEQELRVPLSDAQKTLNVRRAQKMLSVFGEAPPSSLLSVNSRYESPVVPSRPILGGPRFKRHSISSIVTAASSFMDMPEPATFDSPITPITPRPRVPDGEMTATPTRTPTPRNRLTPLAPLSPRRRASLSALPDTPPPFSQYFNLPSPINSAATPEQVRLQDQVSNTPTASQPRPEATATHSPHSSSESSASPPTPASRASHQERGGQKQDPGSVFRERRLRAAKLARFFGVGYGDLYPVLVGSDDDARLSESSFDSMRGARLEPFEKEREKVKEREKKLVAKRNTMTRVSVTVQREVAEPGMTFTSLSSSNSSLSLSSSSEMSTSQTSEAKPDTRMKKAAVVMSNAEPSITDHDVSATGCYGGLSFNANPTPSRSPSTRRRQHGGPVVVSSNSNRTSRYGTSGLGLGVFSLGRQSRRTAAGTGVSNANSNPEVGSATVGRKGSTRTARGTTLTLGQRRSLLTRSSCGEFSSGSPRSIDAMVPDTDAMRLKLIDELDRERDLSGPRIRVGEKIADVNEIMAKLRELR